MSKPPVHLLSAGRLGDSGAMGKGDGMSPGSPRKHSHLVRWCLAILALVAMVMAIKYFPIREMSATAQRVIQDAGPWAPIIFVLAYVVACIFLIPGSFLTLTGGAAFGFVKGVIYVSIGATLGATAAFLISRYLARDWVSKKMEGRARFKAIDHAVAEEGWKIVLLTRLSPVMPFFILNYLLGVTQVRLKDYIWPSWVGMLPGVMLYVFLGHLAHVGTGQESVSKLRWAFYGVGLIATIVVTVFLTRIARKALASRLEPTAPPTQAVADEKSTAKNAGK